MPIVKGEMVSKAPTKSARQAQGMKTLALFYLILVAASVFLVHSPLYGPAVSYVLFYMVVAVLVTLSVATIMLPQTQFSAGFTGGLCLTYAAMLSLAIFFSGGSSSELYLLLVPLLFCAALHGSRGVGVATLVGTLFFFFLAVLPDLLGGGTDAVSMPVLLFRLGLLLSLGLLALFATSRLSGRGALEHEPVPQPEDGGATLLRRAEREIQAHRGVPVAVVLIDPGADVEDVDLLLERVRARVAPPVLLGEESIFGFVVSGGEREVESAARRSLAAASSLGATETRAGAAFYPRDARSAKELLSAAGLALEAAFEIDSPSAIVLSGRAGGQSYRAAR